MRYVWGGGSVAPLRFNFFSAIGTFILLVGPGAPSPQLRTWGISNHRPITLRRSPVSQRRAFDAPVSIVYFCVAPKWVGARKKYRNKEFGVSRENARRIPLVTDISNVLIYDI